MAGPGAVRRRSLFEKRCAAAVERRWPEHAARHPQGDLPEKPGVFDAVKNLNLDIAEGEVMGFVGESGSGKSTVVRILFGLYRPSSGAMQFAEQDVLNSPAVPTSTLFPDRSK